MAGAGYVGEKGIAFVVETIVSARCGYLKPLPIRCCPGPNVARTSCFKVPDRIIGVLCSHLPLCRPTHKKTALLSLSNPHPTTWQRIDGFHR